MNFVHLDTSLIQKLIRYNKVQIRGLEADRKYLEHIIQYYWNSCNPLHPQGVLSSTAFSCLNKAKDELQRVKKTIKMLAELQYSLKYSIR